HPVFGTIIQGMDVVDQIGKVSTNSEDKPLEDVTLIKAMLID
ncbi:peptidylprolyl isomerase, partial [miscellaneous Crenarchaeota group-1 archaeon SG8-32-1]